MDLAAVLARKPEVALIDELAHTNVPGSGPHAKRWEDVLEILEAGIGVVSTVNIQHLESVADAVQQITGVTVRERVPDWVVRRADQLELIDSSPEQLRRRMLHGNVYPPEKIPDALNSFFRYQNLVALRELALRFVADETEEELLGYLVARHPDIVWDTAERIMVAVTAAAGNRCRASPRRSYRVAGARRPASRLRRRRRQLTAGVQRGARAMKHLCEDLGAKLARDNGGRPGPGLGAVRQGQPDHPDRPWGLPALEMGTGDEPGLGRPAGAAFRPSGGRRRPRHRPLWKERSPRAGQVGRSRGRRRLVSPGRPARRPGEGDLKTSPSKTQRARASLVLRRRRNDANACRRATCHRRGSTSRARSRLWRSTISFVFIGLIMMCPSFRRSFGPKSRPAS